MISPLFNRLRIFMMLGAVFFIAGSDDLHATPPAWLPGTGVLTGTDGPLAFKAADTFTLVTTNRSEVLSFYNCVYKASENYAAEMSWSGNVTTHVSGTTSTAFKEDVRRRINFYRALTGLPADIVFSGTESSMCQDAALMFAVNNRLDHYPNPTWSFFLTTGSTAASNSNIALVHSTVNIPISSLLSSELYYGPPAIDGYIADTGTNNAAAGHRRWLLYTQQQTMGTGDIPPSIVTVSGTTYYDVSASSVWINGGTNGALKSSPLLKVVCWPNAGYVPLPLVPARWSLSYPGADFTTATVTMQKSGTNVGLVIVSSTDTGRGDNSLVWEPVGLPTSTGSTPDTTYLVTGSNVLVSGTQTTFSYYVTLFEPALLSSTLTISGTNAPFTTGGAYTFNSIPSADSYQLQVFTNDTVQWTEGAENSPTPQITASTTGTYALRQSAGGLVSAGGTVRTGSNSFQLAFPDPNDVSDQSFMITRSVVPSATSQLQFYDLMRYTTEDVSLSAQVSTDGTNWTTLWSRAGTSYSDPNLGSSAAWDTNFLAASASLSAYAGQIINIRFLFHIISGGQDYIYDSTYPGDLVEYYGFFIDDITVTNAIELLNPTTTTLSGTATSFVLNTTTAGGALVSGTSYSMRMRPSVGLTWYGYTPLKSGTAQAPMTYSNWVTKLYPTVTGGPTAYAVNDGITNGSKFAYGLDPTVHNAPSVLPKPTITSGTMSVSIPQPDGVTGVTYKAEWSTDLVNWTALTDGTTTSGITTTHNFTVSPTPGTPRAFFRYKVILAP